MTNSKLNMYEVVVEYEPKASLVRLQAMSDQHAVALAMARLDIPQGYYIKNVKVVESGRGIKR